MRSRWLATHSNHPDATTSFISHRPCILHICKIVVRGCNWWQNLVLVIDRSSYQATLALNRGILSNKFLVSSNTVWLYSHVTALNFFVSLISDDDLILWRWWWTFSSGDTELVTAGKFIFGFVQIYTVLSSDTQHVKICLLIHLTANFKNKFHGVKQHTWYDEFWKMQNGSHIWVWYAKRNVYEP
jgi:hypothetical protein